jgi:hypothetical protein
MRKNQAGLTHLVILLIIVLLAAVGFAGYYVWNQQKNKNPGSAEPAELTLEEAQENEVKDIYEGWKEYCSPEEKACFKYPADWTYAVTDADTTTLTFKSPAGSEFKWVAAIGGLGGGCDADKDPNIFITGATEVANEPDFYAVEYGTNANQADHIALIYSQNAIATGDTGDCIYFPYFEAKNSTYAGAKASAGLFANYANVVDNEEATVKNIVVSYNY